MTHKDFLKGCKSFNVYVYNKMTTTDGREIEDKMELKNCKIVKLQSDNFSYSYDGMKEGSTSMWGSYGKNSKKVEKGFNAIETYNDTTCYVILKESEQFQINSEYIKEYENGEVYTSVTARSYTKIA